jgi:predicted O-linked N-acetylglucosamine transferase (SPINDLY family)
VTFGSFNNVNKVSDGCIELWAALLRAIPTSRLMMVTVPDGEVRTRLAQQFQALGIAPQRIQFQQKLPSHEFQRALQQVDITLDPFPVNGATTTCESLWLGVPVLSLVGERFLSRAGYSVLHAARLPDFALETQDSLIATAQLLANNLPLLANVRAGLRDHLQVTPLLDASSFTHNLEHLYREAWSRWCEEKAP